MKKNLWALYLLLVFLLTACGGEKVPETTPPPVEVEIPYIEETAPRLPYEGTQLTFRSIWWEEEAQAQVLKQAADFFEKKTGADIDFL